MLSLVMPPRTHAVNVLRQSLSARDQISPLKESKVVTLRHVTAAIGDADHAG